MAPLDGCIAFCGVVALDKPRANHEDITWFDIAALRLRTRIEALCSCTGVQGGQRDAVCRVGVVGGVVVGGGVVVVVVEEDGAGGDAVGGPVVDAAAEGGIRAGDVGWFGLSAF